MVIKKKKNVKNDHEWPHQDIFQVVLVTCMTKTYFLSLPEINLHSAVQYLTSQCNMWTHVDTCRLWPPVISLMYRLLHWNACWWSLYLLFTWLGLVLLIADVSINHSMYSSGWTGQQCNKWLCRFHAFGVGKKTKLMLAYCCLASCNNDLLNMHTHTHCSKCVNLTRYMYKM